MNLFTFTSCLASQIPWQRECQCDMKIDAFSKQIVWDDNDENAFALGVLDIVRPLGVLDIVRLFVILRPFFPSLLCGVLLRPYLHLDEFDI